jgi:hypothetical protein
LVLLLACVGHDALMEYPTRVGSSHRAACDFHTKLAAALATHKEMHTQRLDFDALFELGETGE